MKVAVSRAPGAEREVSPLELFFDLVYVFAIGQLSHHLLEHVDLRTGAETLILALAVIYAWYMKGTSRAPGCWDSLRSRSSRSSRRRSR